MKILALEFSSARRSVAVMDGKTVLAEAGELAGENIPPLRLIATVLAEAKIERTQIECIAVGLGPGSYTGIRGAIALAQGWQLATGVKLLGGSSVDCLAAQAQAENISGNVSIVIDAQRGETYLADYEINEKMVHKSVILTCDLKIVTLTELKSKIATSRTFIGPEVTRWFPEGRVIFPSAAILGRLASERGDFVSGGELEPIYLRTPSFVKAPPLRPFSTL